MEFLGGGKCDMVATFEVVFLIVCAVLGLWWFSRTTTFRAHLRSGTGDNITVSAAEYRMRPPPVRRYDDK